MTQPEEKKPKKKFPVKEMVRRMRIALVAIANSPDRQMRPGVLKALARKLVKQEGRSL